MTSSYALQTYRNVATQLDDKKTILLTVYEGLLNLLDRARSGIEEKNPKERGEAVSKALAVIGELDCALDRELGGEIAQNLENLYRFVTLQLTRANIHNDLKALESARRVIETLKDAFQQAASDLEEAQNAGTPDAAGPSDRAAAQAARAYGTPERKGVSLAV